MATIDFLLPTPLKGSGGHRTIVANAEALAAAGHRVRLHVQESRKIRSVVQKTRDWHGVRLCEIDSGWPTSLPDSDAVMATTWFTAGPVARMSTPGTRLYFVQDYDPLFHPAGDVGVAAAGTFTLGLRTLVIGRWLQHKLQTDHGVATWSLPFTADLSTYRRDNSARRRRVVAILQPEKPRRCPDLVAETLHRVLASNDVEVVTVGSPNAPSVGPGHRHVGVVSVAELASLYSSSRVGLCISASNPSRIPFEMMACGLPVVEVALPNTVYDLPTDGCLLAHPDPDSLALALERLIEDGGLHQKLSRGGTEYMQTRPQSAESTQFVAFVEAQLERREIRAYDPRPVYERPAVIATDQTLWVPHRHRRSKMLPSRR